MKDAKDDGQGANAKVADPHGTLSENAMIIAQTQPTSAMMEPIIRIMMTMVGVTQLGFWVRFCRRKSLFLVPEDRLN
jgi:hypothetical protein